MNSSSWAHLPDHAVPPGAVLADRLEYLGMTQSELAGRMGRSQAKISQIVNGEKAVTPETALQLERTVGTSADMWLRLQAQYDATRARLEDRERLLAEEADQARAFPYAEMTRRGWVPDTRVPIERIEHLLHYLGVSSLTLGMDQLAAAPAMFRVARCKEPSGCALAVWLRQGQIEARDIGTASFSKRTLEQALPALRTMTREDPTKCFENLRSTLAGCGVAIAVVPPLKGTHVQGATQWLARDKAMIELSGRYKWADVFWFDLFHEIGHLLLHKKADGIFIKFTDGVERDPRETEADHFAAELLVPPADYERLLTLAPLSKARVSRFGREIGVGPGVVVGRLQHEGELPRTHLNDLRVSCGWPAN